MEGSNCYFLTRVQFSQVTSKMVWYLHLFDNFPQFVVISTVKTFPVVNETEVDVFLAFWVVMLPKTHLTSHSRMSGSE